MSRFVNRVRKARSTLRRALIEAQNNLCAYCFDPMAPAFPWSPRAATLDHVFPQSGGGTDATCVACHFECNRAKGHRKPTGCDLLALDWVRTRVHGSPRLSALVSHALEVIGGSPRWALEGRVKPCQCAECRELDASHPHEGRQLVLPVIRP